MRPVLFAALTVLLAAASGCCCHKQGCGHGGCYSGHCGHDGCATCGHGHCDPLACLLGKHGGRGPHPGAGQGCSTCGNEGCNECGQHAGGHNVAAWMHHPSVPQRSGILAHHHDNQRGPALPYDNYQPAPGPSAAAVAYPYYTVRGPRDFLSNNPRGIGP